MAVRRTTRQNIQGNRENIPESKAFEKKDERTSPHQVAVSLAAGKAMESLEPAGQSQKQRILDETRQYFLPADALTEIAQGPEHIKTRELHKQHERYISHILEFPTGALAIKEALKLIRSGKRIGLRKAVAMAIGIQMEEGSWRAPWVIDWDRYFHNPGLVNGPVVEGRVNAADFFGYLERTYPYNDYVHGNDSTGSTPAHGWYSPTHAKPILHELEIGRKDILDNASSLLEDGRFTRLTLAMERIRVYVHEFGYDSVSFYVRVTGKVDEGLLGITPVFVEKNKKYLEEVSLYCSASSVQQACKRGFSGENIVRAAILFEYGIGEDDFVQLMKLAVRPGELLWAVKKAVEMEKPTTAVIVQLAISLKQWGDSALKAWNLGIRPSTEDPLDTLFYLASKVCVFKGQVFIKDFVTAAPTPEEKKELLFLADTYGHMEVREGIKQGLSGADLFTYLEQKKARQIRRQMKSNERGSIGHSLRELNIYLEKLEEVSPELARVIRNQASRALR